MSREYALQYTNTARKGIKNLDGSVRRRVRRAIEALAHDPRPSGCVQIKGHTDMWRVRVGDYRIRYAIDDGVLVVLVLKVASRGGFYDDL
ncbi:type II toxin-antitoxin system RelE/ParE family toxin [Nocardiopsis exhalans]|uniref:Type II toxin-antitoxin system RelE/ParE family toxin n=1 Tax=Nocardiopsis exhalans TaxID=163604 RepID=A0ABY5DGI1_9ACTN|nr:type II toxin-antitoxin system RelE/ParE family toxin [Nocardiopsis exhalans]USY22494.1 type II toxin-antitoxin system RelE/ParE family toxin [Nocardiopsis exhalans]